MRDRIWTELTQTKHSIEFTALYADRQRAIVRYFNISILTFSTGGVMGWPLWDDLPMVACVIIALVSLIRLLQPHLIMSDKLLNDLDRIHIFYTDHYNQLEKLWYEFERNALTEKQASDKFYKIIAGEKELAPLISETVRRKPKGLTSKAKEYSDNFFKQTFNV
jgi:hypothetical protein